MEGSERKMELKFYLRILLERWWIALLIFLITIGSTIFFTLRQVPTYSATATFVVSPSSSFSDARSFLTGLDALDTGRSLVANTYSDIATSDTVRQEAIHAMGLSVYQSDSLIIDSKLRAGTNVIEITAEGNDPSLVFNFANKVGENTVNYVQKLYGVYDLKPLDAAKAPVSPIRPNRKLYIALGGLLGLFLGVGLVFFLEYLQSPLEKKTSFGIVDHSSGASNKQYFMQRLREELVRARRYNYPLALGLMNVDLHKTIKKSIPPESQGEALQIVTSILEQSLRKEDVLVWMDGTIIGLLLPNTMADEAKAVLEQLQERLTEISFDLQKNGVVLNLSVASGLVPYDWNGTRVDEMISKGYRALRIAEAYGSGRIILA
jgi:diguanylate cyclase (GGDEF)-like protein